MRCQLVICIDLCELNGLTRVEPLVCLHELSSTGEYWPPSREMESLVTENAVSEASTKSVELSLHGRALGK